MNHVGTQYIETERLILRRFELSDARAMFDNWASDDEVTKYLTWPAHSGVSVTEQLLEDWVSQYSKNDCYRWAIVLKENGPQPIGSGFALNHERLSDFDNPGLVSGKSIGGRVGLFVAF